MVARACLWPDQPSQFPLESRLRFLHRLDAAADGWAVAWVSAEGVGVAPCVKPGLMGA
jgi:hypothetical protein